MRTFFKKLLIVSLLVCASVFAYGEDPSQLEIVLGGVTYVQVVPPRAGARPNKNILFIFDCSASMKTSRIAEALTFLVGISAQPIDEMQFAVLAFDSPIRSRGGLYRWPGIPEDSGRVPKGWAALPSAIAIPEAVRWINETRGHAGGSTYVVPALRAAYQENRDDLSIVLITDGAFNDPIPSEVDMLRNKYILSALQGSMKARRENPELSDDALLMVYGVDSLFTDLASMGSSGGLGYYRKSKKAKDNDN